MFLFQYNFYEKSFGYVCNIIISYEVSSCLHSVFIYVRTSFQREYYSCDYLSSVTLLWL